MTLAFSKLGISGVILVPLSSNFFQNLRNHLRANLFFSASYDHHSDSILSINHSRRNFLLSGPLKSELAGRLAYSKRRQTHGLHTLHAHITSLAANTFLCADHFEYARLSI